MLTKDTSFARKKFFQNMIEKEKGKEDNGRTFSSKPETPKGK